MSGLSLGLGQVPTEIILAFLPLSDIVQYAAVFSDDMPFAQTAIRKEVARLMSFVEPDEILDRSDGMLGWDHAICCCDTFTRYWRPEYWGVVVNLYCVLAPRLIRSLHTHELLILYKLLCAAYVPAAPAELSVHRGALRVALRTLVRRLDLRRRTPESAEQLRDLCAWSLVDACKFGNLCNAKMLCNLRGNFKCDPELAHVVFRLCSTSNEPGDPGPDAVRWFTAHCGLSAAVIQEYTNEGWIPM